MLEKIDIKVIFIFVLAGALILSFIFRPSKEIDTYEDEISALRKENETLKLNNDSLYEINEILSIEIQELMENVDSTEAALNETEDKLNDLEDGKSEVSGYVKTLNADGIAESLSDYLNRK